MKITIQKFLCLVSGILVFCLPVMPVKAAPASTPTAVQQVRIGVLAYRGAEKTLQMWNPLARYLNRKIAGYRFRILPLTNDDIAQMIEQGRVDFILTNPASYAILEVNQGISRLATLKKNHQNRDYSLYGAVIFTRADNKQIYSLGELRGKRFMAVHNQAFGGWWMAKRLFMSQGISPASFSKIQYSGFPQDRVVESVLAGKVDAGTVRTSVIERMVMEGKLKRNQIRVLNRHDSLYFPFLLSTRLYPEWAFASARSTDPALSQKVSHALQTLRADSAASKAAGISGWSAPLSYKPVHELLRKLRVGPYSELGKISFSQVVSRYWPSILAGMIVILLMALATVYILGLNKRLLESNQKLVQENHLRRELEEKLKRQALYDVLTDIPNRTLLSDRMQQAINSSKREQEGFALAVIDLDEFKDINDNHGHQVGDRVIQQVAARFRNIIRQTDTIARLGGDEFVLLIEDIGDGAIVDTMAHKCLAVLEQPFKIDDKEFSVSASVGIAHFPDDGATADLLLRHADLAMYAAKKQGSRVCRYSEELARV